MFDAVRNQKRIVQVLLGLIALSFAIWGVGDYVREVPGGGEVATVGDTSITQQNLEQALREQEDRLREALGSQFDSSVLDRPEARQAALETVIRQRLVQLAIHDERILVTDDQLRQAIASIPALQVDGQFSRERYEEALRRQNLTEAAFEFQLRQDLAVQRLITAVAESAYVPRSSALLWTSTLIETREVSEAVIKPEQFASQVKVTPESVKAYYEKNRSAFEVPEQVRAEYLVLSQEKIAEQISVSDEEVKDWYAKNAERFKQPEERRASHILIQVPADAPEAQVTAAREKIEDILEQVRRNPADFARLAREHSQDPGSAPNGGDLGYFGRSAMVKAFEDAVFALRENEVSDVVRTDFGFHIIKLTGIREEKTRGLEELKPRIVAEIKSQAAANKFAEMAEGFSNTVYEQADSLKPAAEKFNLSTQQTGFFSRNERGAAGPLNNDRVIAELFSDEAVKNRRNTDAIEVAPNTLVAARVVEHKPASLMPFESVAPGIESRIKMDEMAKLAQKAGEAKLAQIRKGEQSGLEWSKPRSVTRSGEDQAFSTSALHEIFRAPVETLPSYVGVPLPSGGYGIFRIIKVTRPEIKEDDPRLKAQRQQLAQLAGAGDFDAYLAGLRERYGVEINRKALTPREQ